MKKVYKFSGEYCTPCKLMIPAWKAVKSALGDKINFIEVNIEKDPELTEKFEILTLPTFVVEINNKEIARHSGLLTKEKLERFIVESNE